MALAFPKLGELSGGGLAAPVIPYSLLIIWSAGKKSAHRKAELQHFDSWALPFDRTIA